MAGSRSPKKQTFHFCWNFRSFADEYIGFSLPWFLYFKHTHTHFLLFSLSFTLSFYVSVSTLSLFVIFVCINSFIQFLFVLRKINFHCIYCQTFNLKEPKCELSFYRNFLIPKSFFAIKKLFIMARLKINYVLSGYLVDSLSNY